MIRMLLGASAMTTLGSLPVFLLSAQSVYVQAELGFGERAFGIAVSVFFAAAALAALLGGGLADRLGPRRSTALAGCLAVVGGVGAAWVAQSWLVLVVAMFVLGVANAACQVTSNLMMARLVPRGRQGLGFGVKQSAIPMSILLAGLAVPTLGAVVGWRGTFGLVALGGLAILVASFALQPPRPGEVGSEARVGDRPPLRALLTTMCAVMLASAAANSLGSFTAVWGHHVGLSPGEAGLLMAAGSAVNISLRVVMGHLADRRQGRNLPVVAAQMLAGAVALVGLSIPLPAAVVVAGLLAFGVGWSWPGLLIYAVVRVGRDYPGTASGIVQAGAFIGGATGPAVFGVAVHAFGYPVAWRSAALAFALAACLVLLARRIFVADLLSRPPRRPLARGPKPAG